MSDKENIEINDYGVKYYKSRAPRFITFKQYMKEGFSLADLNIGYAGNNTKFYIFFNASTKRLTMFSYPTKNSNKETRLAIESMEKLDLTQGDFYEVKFRPYLWGTNKAKDFVIDLYGTKRNLKKEIRTKDFVVRKLGIEDLKDIIKGDKNE